MNQYIYFALGIVLGISLAVYYFMNREEKIESQIELDQKIYSTKRLDTAMENVVENINKKIKELKRELTEDEKNEIKSLISDIAHQLKTPLTNMKMYSEFLQDDDLSEEDRKEFNKVILLSLNKLCFLVESMIKMSRLESSVINLHKTKCDINESILDAITSVYRKAKNKNINIEFNTENKIEIKYDKKWTTEAIFNIVENAVKYSPNNSEISINIEKYEMFARIDIKDSGVGIPEEEIPKIFRRFYRGINVLNEEGIGIGLYLSREIITKQNGYIKVSSSQKGSIFSIFLPNE